MQFHKYLKSREKGALMVNAGYISDKRPDEPAFDWVAFSEIQKTRDRTIQQQIAAKFVLPLVRRVPHKYNLLS